MARPCPLDGKSCPVYACLYQCQTEVNPPADPVIATPAALFWARWYERLPPLPPWPPGYAWQQPEPGPPDQPT